jgi:hypothetical protein
VIEPRAGTSATASSSGGRRGSVVVLVVRTMLERTTKSGP